MIVFVAVFARLEHQSFSQNRAPATLPDGPGAATAKRSCLFCHEVDLMVQQRLSRAAWAREVDKMIRWGAEVSAPNKEQLIDYFASHFAAGSRASSTKGLADDAGIGIVKSACLICHESDLIVQQRLSRAGWTREVDKMIRWGADVEPDEKQILIDYLSKHYPPTRR